MKRCGDIINGYRLLTEPTNSGGGNCMWAFADKDGWQFFLKQFLDPKRPKEGSGSAASRKLRLDECEEFEERHSSIMKRLRPAASGSGNLVLAVDFFCEGSTYYKVTERIETSSLDHPERLSAREKAVLLRTLVLSVKQLHDIDVVHGDLKPGNILVQKKHGSPFHVAKLIDFDDSYLSGKPPGRDVIGGDMVFGSPEWRRYMQEDEDVLPEYLTPAADMFALGLIIHYYLTGGLPGHDDRFQFPADSVEAGASLRMDERLSPAMAGLVRTMTARAPGARPQIATLLDRLTEETCALGVPARTAVAEPAKAVGSAESTAAPNPAGSRVKVNENGRTPGARSASIERPGRSASRVRINLTDRHR